jgi:TonB family protein
MSLLRQDPVCRVSYLHLRNLLRTLPATSLKRMELRALLFSADGGSTATLCQILTELGIEAEICSEMLVASERISREPYDAIVVDWDHESDAAFLLKKAREQRVFSLNLALVPDDAAITRALQQGANSVIRKPIDPAQAQDTLSTARALILSRRAEQHEKQARLSAIEEESAEPVPDNHTVELPSPKTGFLQQTMAHSAFEAEEKVGKAELGKAELGKPDRLQESGWQAARGPATLSESPEPEPRPVEPFTKKRWDDVKSIFREPAEGAGESAQESEPATNHSHDSTGIFSSFAEKAEETSDLDESESSSPPQYVVFAVVACVLITGVLYVWAPGDSYLGRMTSAFHAFLVKARTAPEKTASAPAPTPSDRAPAETVPQKPEDAFAQDPPVESTDVDPSKIQIIETKAVPKAGAQQPPNNEPPPDSDQARVLSERGTNASAVDAKAVDPAAAVQTQPPAVANTAPESSAAPPAPVSAAPAPTRAPENVVPSTDRRTVIIPDSLRTTPAPSPASNLESPFVPESTSQRLLIHRVEPEYPAQALAQRLEGAVVLQAWIGKDGTVRDVKLLTGYFLLGRAAFDAVKQWRFKPFTQNGTVQDFQTTIRLNFNYPK